MARYQFGADENVTESMQALLTLAGEDRVGDVVYQPGVGPAGAVELPEDLHGEWVKIKADHDADRAKESDAADADEAEDAETDDEGTDEGKASGRVSRRGAAAKKE